MKLMHEMREILKQVNYVIWVLSNKELQQDVWQNGKYENRIFSFNEAINTIFDDYRFDELVKNERLDFNLSIELRDLIKGFLDLIIKFDPDGLSVREIINHPDFELIRERAKKVNTELEKLINTLN